jgi:electron transfer flavoprotein beta subunit
VTVVTVGEPPAEQALREAVAAGAARAVRVDAPRNLTSDAVAGAIAAVATTATWVVCGDASADRGTGAVPAYLAAELGAAQALGLVAVDPITDDGTVRVTRRLDGGRREVLDVRSPAVLAVEGAVARLRRASLPAELAARHAPIERLIGPRQPVEVRDLAHPYRPRPRALAAPTGDALERVRGLTDAAGGATVSHGDAITLDPPAAAERILATLVLWGYLDG